MAFHGLLFIELVFLLQLDFLIKMRLFLNLSILSYLWLFMINLFLIMLMHFSCVFGLLPSLISFFLPFLSLYLSRHGFLFIAFGVIDRPMFLRFIGRVLELIKALKNLSLSVSFLLFLPLLLPVLLLIIRPFLYLSCPYIRSLTHIIINPTIPTPPKSELVFAALLQQ